MATPSHILGFDDPESGTNALVGGKGANLGQLTRAGFPVPSGFVVTTSAYSDFLRTASLEDKIAGILSQAQPDDAEKLELLTGEIRELILSAAIPAPITSEIEQAYHALGEERFVAVRSSGTAEDLDEASFAGLHDTFLDVRGAEAIIDAVRRCWASLWTARVAAYRHDNGINQLQAGIAVVVQTMVESEVSGVMFTGNPLTTATDEIVINSSWGLGEAVVSGIVTPDEYVLKAGTLKVLDRTLGTKTIRIVRSRATGQGTVTEPVPAHAQGTYTLSDGQAADLGEIGRRVQAFYDELPQDIEWARADGTFYLLQARPVTGVEFSWDADLDTWQWAPEGEADTLWTRAFADQVWTGAVTPLMYSFRGRAATDNYQAIGRGFGIEELKSLRVMKFHKAEAYFNPDVEKLILQKTWPTPLRSDESLSLSWLPPTWRPEVIATPFSYLTYLRMHARLMAVEPRSYRWFKVMDGFINHNEWDLERLADIHHLSDDDLRRSLDEHFDYELRYGDWATIPYMVWVRDAVQLLALIVTKWCDPAVAMSFPELMVGCRVRSKTMEENYSLFTLSEMIRKSPELSELFMTHPGAEFFTEAEHSEAGRGFLAEHRAFMKVHGHRGSEDRDLYYPRRLEDPSVDYRALKTMLSMESMDPAAREDEVNARRDAAFDQVLENLTRKPLGILKAEAFKIVYDWVQKFIAVRDDSRWSYERYIFGIKLLCGEMGRRLAARGLLDSDRDVFFLSKDELVALTAGRANPKLTRAKIAGRSRDFERVLHRDRIPPMFLQRNRAVRLEPEEGTGSLRGNAISGGTYTGTARVIRRLEGIDRVKPGEILVCNATDPGWTPVFMIIRGIVTETGGILAHASCLSREYGLPSVALPRAMELIPDGATITVDGDLGEVVILGTADL